MAEHASECALCSKYAADMQALDAQLNAALRVPLPERSVSHYMTGAKRGTPEPAAAPRRNWFALAASLVPITLGLDAFLYLSGAVFLVTVAANVMFHHRLPGSSG